MIFFLFILLTPIKFYKFSKILTLKRLLSKVRIIKEKIFTFLKVLSEIFNFYIKKNTFPDGLKKADIKPVYKKDDLFHLKLLSTTYMIKFI